MIRRVAVAVALVAAAGGCGLQPTPPAGGVVVSFGRHALAAEVAATPEARERGLMGRRSLGRNAGMIFLFPSPATCGDRPCGFWMKDTLIPLSIAYMSRTGARTYRVVSVMEMTPFRTPYCPTYAPALPYDAAAEANAGWYSRAGVRPGAHAVVVGASPAPS